MSISISESPAAVAVSSKPVVSGGLRAFVGRLAIERNLYGALAFAETAESLRLIRVALEPKPGDRIAGITSSGDVLLALAACGAEVVGFDHNPVQTALAEMKRAAMSSLDVARYRGLFGVDAMDPAARKALFEALEMPENARSELRRQRGLIEAGALNRGMTYLIIRALAGLLKRLIDDGELALFMGDEGSDADRAAALHKFTKRGVTAKFLAPLLARHAAQLKWIFFPHTICRVSERPDQMIAAFFETFAPLFTKGARANPVLCRAATDHVHPEWLDELYSPQIFAAIKQAKASFETSSFTEGLRSLPEKWATQIYLSNAPDYLTEPQLDELAEVIKQKAQPDAKILYFSLCDLDRFGARLGATHDVQHLHEMDNVCLYPAIVLRGAA